VIDVLLTLLALSATVALVCVAVVALGVAPFVLTVDAAERRGFSPTRWGAFTLTGTLLMLALGYWVVHGHHTRVLLLPALIFGWAALGVLSLLSRDQTRVGGTQGAHER
jgi:hypothetical protein